MVASGRVSNIQNDAEHDLNSCAQEKMGLPCLRASGGAASSAQAGGVDTDAMKTEDTERATSSEALAVAAPIRPFGHGR